MAGNKKSLPIGYIPTNEPALRPFVLDWSDKTQAENSFIQSTNKYEDTCFTQMVTAGHVPAAPESVSSTSSSLGGELADTATEV